MEHSFITQQSVGTQFSGVYYVANVGIKKARNNKEYMDITLKDRSGSVFAKAWEVNPDIVKGMYLYASISCEDYQGSPSYIIRNMEEYTKEVDASLYIPTVADKEALIDFFDKAMAEAGAISDAQKAPIGAILKGVFKDAVKKAFFNAPSSTGAYYGKVGGALENTVNIVKLVLNMCQVYNLKEDERLIALAGALLSRVSCVETYTMAECVAEETKTGALIGLKSLTMLRFLDTWKELGKGSQDREWFVRLLHVVSSDENSTTKPSTKEAIILKKAIEMDLQMSEMFDYIEREENWQDGFSTFDTANKRRYYQTPEA